MATAERAYLAVDLGAGSGRVILGWFRADRLALHELHRFEQPTHRAGGHDRWRFEALCREVVEGLHRAGTQTVVDPAAIRSVSVDGWGVDYGLLDAQGTLLEDPVCYRDARTEGCLERLFERVPAARIYACTGIQFLPINTLVQLFAQVESGEWPAEARRLLTVPDLVHAHLGGAAVCERTNASTTQLLDARTRTWSAELAQAIGVPPAVLPPLVDGGARLGPLRPALAQSTKLANLQIVAAATHDTACAVAGTPLEDGWAYLSSGTWSLLGVETQGPVLGEDARRANVTNEGGVFGTNRLLKNVMGLWLLEACRKRWSEEGRAVDHEALLGGLSAGAPGTTFLQPDDPRFLNPADMPAAIHARLRETGQEPPTDPRTLTRVILESLALRYAAVLDDLRALSGLEVRGIHVVGGGSRNAFLNQATANATGLPVRVGPVEATAIGNLLLQAIADGLFPDLATARRFVAENTAVHTITPRHVDAWRRARGRMG